MDFAERFNPSIQLSLIKLSPNYVLCYNLNYPTLQEVDDAYGTEALINWLKIHFNNLNDYVGTRERMDMEQINEISFLFFYDCSILKISEVAFFFIQVKNGRFGEFYGAVDPLRLMTAKNRFMDERKEALHKYRIEQEKAHTEAERERSRQNAITYEQYLALKQTREQTIESLTN